ncbi:hypothetical protein E1263_08315 [Kribbella antibiotica]|uniref:DUF559 domain-containing protein n=1 Tax=Kribbella antibiotica TaxID=190195 RepID=A0A4R4ZQE7_9ACTN|nr:hypothetical protein [Kribbella antibiotica]TDD61181.1 hypothetical protein E1263_08315 [Kribbella antibiotica]
MRRVGAVSAGWRRDLLAAGITRAQLQSADWVSPHFGYHRSTGLRDEVRQRIVDVAAVMPPEGVLGGWASAYLQGVAFLDGGWAAPGTASGLRGEPVLVVLPPDRRTGRSDISSLRAALDPADVVEVGGIRCTNGVRTAFDMLRLAPDLTEAVVGGDCLLHAGLTTAPGLARYADSHQGRRGVRQLRAALPLLEGLAASPPESRLRLLCHQAGLQNILVNVPVYDLDGTFLGIVDLLEDSTGLSLEYDGEYHRELGQQTRDNHREERLERVGLTMLRVTALDMQEPGSLVRRIRQAHQACRSDPAPRQWVHQLRAA